MDEEEQKTNEMGAPGGAEPSVAEEFVDGWAVRRADAFKLLSEAELISKPNPVEAQTLALVGIGHALLALDDRLANQPPPVYVITPSGDLAADREFLEEFSKAMDRAAAFGRGDVA